MANPAEIVNVSIVIKDAAANVTAFSNIAIFAKAPFLGWRTYDLTPDGLTAMLTDGFTVGSAAYLKAAAMVAQEIKPATVKVWSRTLVNAQSVELTPTTTTEGFVYSLTIVLPSGVSNDITVTCGAAESVATLCDKLTTALTLTGVTPTDNTTKVTLTPTTAGTRFYLRSVIRDLKVEDVSPDAGIATDLAAAALADPDFYGVILDSNGKAEIVACAAWCLSNEKLFHALSLDSEVEDGGVSDDVVSTLVTAGNTRANVVRTRDGYGMIDAGWMARQIVQTPGSTTWALKTIPGANVDNWNATELTALKAKKALYYTTFSGLSLTQFGAAASGRFFDITIGVDWLKSTMTGDVLTYLASREKVDFTDPGIGEIEAPIRARMQLAENNKLLKPGWTVTMPKEADVPTVDKAARNLPGIKFNGILAGAIHKVSINGTVTL